MQKIFTFLIVVVFLFPASGQNYENLTQWEVGAEFGGNLSWMSGQWSSDDQYKHKPIFTPSFGFTGAYNFTPLIAVAAGLSMIKTGVVYESSGEDSEQYTDRERFTTLRLNPMARFRWGTRFQYYALAGVYMSKILCGKYVFKYPSGDYEQSGKIIFKDEPEGYTGEDVYYSTDLYRRLDFGLNLGGGVRYGIGPGLIYFNMLFGMGFCDFKKWNNDQWNGIQRPDGYRAFLNRNISFMFGYVILLGATL